MSLFLLKAPALQTKEHYSSIRVLLILGRISNLPTVWSNCLAAWLLAGDRSWYSFGLICLGATLLYSGGMFLNDAIDQGFDRQYRPERPIVSGAISSRLVWILSGVWLVTGWAVFATFGNRPAIIAGLLAFAIISYDVVHKRTRLAPLLMAACRFLLYCAAASVLNHQLSSLVLWKAAVLAVYIVGLSYLARGESTGVRALRWTIVLVFAPALAAIDSHAAAPVYLSVLLFSAWTCWCVFGSKSKWLSLLPRGVSGLLAGIVLTDLVAAAGHGFSIWFIALFLLALLLQRVAPAT